MNKFVAIALLAFACQTVVANVEPSWPLQEEVESQAAIVPDNTEEVAQLDDTTRVFSQFCLDTRDFLVKDVKDRANEKASNLFKLFFNNVQVVAQEALDINKDATEQFTKQIAHPETEFSKGSNEHINEGLSRIQLAQVQPQSFLNAFISNVKAVGSSIAENVQARIDRLSQGLTVAEFTKLLVGACDQVHEYHVKFESKFAAEKALSPIGGLLSYDQVKCMTTQRISRLDAMCSMIGRVKQPMQQIFGQA